MKTVTVNAKRNNWEWVFVCAGCGLLASSKRSDAMTCSTACRVRAHRSGRIKELHGICQMFALKDERTGKPKPEGILHASAITELCPELADQILAGHLTNYQAMPETYSAFLKLAMEQARIRK